MIKTSLSKGEILAALAAGTYGYSTSDSESPYLRALAWTLMGGLASKLQPKLVGGITHAADDIINGTVKSIKNQSSKVKII